VTGGFEDAPLTQASDLEGALFNITVTLCRLHCHEMPPQAARELVADYLEKIVIGLRSVEEEATP
jgi:hypothetical protein